MDGEPANLKKRQDESSDSRLRRISMTVGLSSLRTLERETGLNPRLQPWQGCTLPLSYSRIGNCFLSSARVFCQRDGTTKFQPVVSREIGRNKHFPFVIVHLSFGNTKCVHDSMPNFHRAISGQRQINNDK